jgi:hypothetical protein
MAAAVSFPYYDYAFRNCGINYLHIICAAEVFFFDINLLIARCNFAEWKILINFWIILQFLLKYVDVLFDFLRATQILNVLWNLSNFQPTVLKGPTQIRTS